MNSLKFEKIFFSDLSLVKPILNEALLFMKKKFPNISIDEQCECRLVFSELLCNAVIHGNKKDKTKKVKFSLVKKNELICCIIEDEGDGFNFDNLTLGRDLDKTLLNENGRGLYIVSQLTHSLEFNSKGNSIKCIKKVHVSG